MLRPPVKMCIIDTETTGLHNGARILQLSIVTYVDGKEVSANNYPCNAFADSDFRKELASSAWARNMVAGAEKVHHITEASLKGKPEFYQQLPKILEEIGGSNYLLFQNAPFDLRMMHLDFERAKEKWRVQDVIFSLKDFPRSRDDPRVIDTLQIAQSSVFDDIRDHTWLNPKAKITSEDPEWDPDGGPNQVAPRHEVAGKKRNLDVLCSYFKVKVGKDRDVHDAVVDAQLTGQVLRRMIRSDPSIIHDYIKTLEYKKQYPVDSAAFDMPARSQFTDIRDSLGWRKPRGSVPESEFWTPSLQETGKGALLFGSQRAPKRKASPPPEEGAEEKLLPSAKAARI